MGRNIVETIMGALVLAVAIAFVVFAFTTGDRGVSSGYEVLARFDRVDGLKRGSDVTMGGIKVGTVTSMEIDQKDGYRAVVKLSINADIKLPTDTVARIVSESLLGGMVIVLEPGGEEKFITAGKEISKTQGSVLLSDLLARFIFGGTGGGSPPSK